MLGSTTSGFTVSFGGDGETAGLKVGGGSSGDSIGDLSDLSQPLRWQSRVPLNNLVITETNSEEAMLCE